MITGLHKISQPFSSPYMIPTFSLRDNEPYRGMSVILRLVSVVKVNIRLSTDHRVVYDRLQSGAEKRLGICYHSWRAWAPNFNDSISGTSVKHR